MMVQSSRGNETIIRFLKRHLDIRSKSGLEWQALCPFHEDSSPSFSVNIRKGLYICYACGEKGNMKQLAKHFNDKEPANQSASLEEVSENIQQLSEQLHQTTRPTIEIPYPSRFTDNPMVIPFWRDKRGVQPIQISDYRLGYDELEDDAIIPVSDINGRILGLVRRTNSKEKIELGYPKYKYPKGLKISEVLFGADVAMKRPSKYAKMLGYNGIHRSVLVICEGSVDAASVCHVAQFFKPKQNWSGNIKTQINYIITGVAVLGARISLAQSQIIRKIAPNYILIATDRDRAGREAEMQIETTLNSMRMGIPIAKLSWDSSLGKDFAELTYHARGKIMREALEQFH